MILAGLEFFVSSNLDLGDLQVHLGPQGFLSYLLPVIMLLCGGLAWATPDTRLFYGIVGLLAATYSLIGLNLGGFIVGMVLGIIGGGLTIAWSPAAATTWQDTDRAAPSRRRHREAVAPVADIDPSVRPEADADPGTASNCDADAGAPGGAPAAMLPDGGSDAVLPDGDAEAVLPDEGADAGPAGGARDTVELPSRYPAGREPESEPDGDRRPDVEDAAPVEGSRHAAPTDDGPAGGHRSAVNPWFGLQNLVVVGSVVLTVAAGSLAVGERSPAQAAPCPVPEASRSRAAPSVAPSRTPAAAATGTPERAGAEVSASAPPPTTRVTAPPTGTGNPIVDAWNGFVEGLRGALDGGRAPEPTAPPAGPPAAAPGGEPAPGVNPAPPPTRTPQPAPSRPVPSKAPSPSEVPCLGPRLDRTSALDADVPVAAARPGTLRGGTLTMFDATFEGVATLQTADGPLRVLHFTMSRAVTEQFALDVAEVGGTTTAFTSPELTISGNVQFFTPEFSGKLFGLVPLTFTPDFPPPLLLPELTFTDVVIALALVRSDTLRADLTIKA